MSMQRLVSAIGRRILWRSITLLMYLLRVVPIRKNKILFVNYFGKGYGDNAKYICNELLKSDEKLDIVWALSDLNEEMPERVRLVKYDSLRYFYELCTSHVWVDNCRKPLYVRKRKGQYYIQTWHADMGIKKAEGDATDSLYPSYIKGAMNDSKMADLFIAGNTWMEALYRNAYWYDGEICKCGYPRRDILYSITSSKINQIKFAIGIRENVRVVIYAPTFRRTSNLNAYKLDWDLLLNALEKRFGGKWMGMIRLHPNISKLADEYRVSSRVLNVTNYPDMQELLAISDVCISDYSSVILEFAITGKPAFIYATDLDEYKNDRGIYFSLEELPFSFSNSNDSLVENIETFNANIYHESNKKFYSERLGVFEKGDASKKLVEIINGRCRG